MTLLFRHTHQFKQEEYVYILGAEPSCLILELVPLRHFKLRKQNRILLPLSDSFQNFRRAPRLFCTLEPPPHRATDGRKRQP